MGNCVTHKFSEMARGKPRDAHLGQKDGTPSVLFGSRTEVYVLIHCVNATDTE